VPRSTSPRRRAAVIALALVLTGALGGCSGTPAPEDTSEADAPASAIASAEAEAEDLAEDAPAADVGDLDVCAALPLETLNSITGRTYARIDGTTSDSQEYPLAACVYQAESDDLDKLLVFTVYVYPSGGEAAVAAYKDFIGTPDGYTPVSGVGDSAEATESDLIARFGDQVVVGIDVVSTEDSAALSSDQFAEIVQTVHDGL